MCYCIKKLVVEIDRIDEDLFSVRDRSIVSTPDMAEAQRLDYQLKIYKDERELVILNVPLNGARTYSSKELGIQCLDDDCYCLEVESCDRVIKQNFCYMPDLKCCIEEAILKSPDDEKYRKLLEDFEVACILQEHGRSKETRQKYEDICEAMKNCAV